MDPAAVEWTGAVCSALVPLVERVQAPPTPDVTDPDATRQAFSTYLADAVQDADRAVEEVSAAGAPPIENGAEVSQAVSVQVDELRMRLADARAQIEGVDQNDPAALARAAVEAASDVIGSLDNVVEVATVVSEDPTLRPAFEQAPSCAPLRAISIPS